MPAVGAPHVLDTDLLRTFVTVVDCNSFSRAAERLLRGQSAVSLQIKRLESQLGAELIERGRGGLRMTPDGELILDHARRILQLNEELIERIAEPDLSGLVRIGAPEDFATTYLQDVLAKFANSHPKVALEMTCELTMQLFDRFAAGGLDLALVKREATAAPAGRLVWREALVWVGNRAIDSEAAEFSLVVSPVPCVYRKRATAALDAARIAWRIAYTCGALSGSLAAVRAGMGITVLPKNMVPADLVILDPAGEKLPVLADTEIALLESSGNGAPASRLRDVIEQALHHGYR
ncbi:MAG: LysR substrate-binding domain-containing protein [Parerythrobacter sp.]